jgi:hypothetical protein
MKYFKKLSPFSLGEMLSILKYTIGSILVSQISKGLRNCYHFTQDLSRKGIP